MRNEDYIHPNPEDTEQFNRELSEYEQQLNQNKNGNR